VGFVWPEGPDIEKQLDSFSAGWSCKRRLGCQARIREKSGVWPTRGSEMWREKGGGKRGDPERREASRWGNAVTNLGSAITGDGHAR